MAAARGKGGKGYAITASLKDRNKASEFYNNIAPKYNKEIAGESYQGPALIVSRVLFYQPARDCRVIDLAAGTGLVGIELKKQGYTHIDALDASEGMLAEARRTGVYTNLYHQALGDGKGPAPRGVYDVVTVSWVVGDGYLPLSALQDMLDLTKQGGLLVIGNSDEQHRTPEGQRVDNALKQLDRDGKVRWLERVEVRRWDSQDGGHIHVYRKTG